MQRFWDDESQRLGLSYGVMVALQFLVLPVLVRIRVRQLTGRSDFRIAPFCLCLVGEDWQLCRAACLNRLIEALQGRGRLGWCGGVLTARKYLIDRFAPG